MIALGKLSVLVEAIPREMLRDPSVSGPDLRRLAERLDHAAAQCRCLAECKPEGVVATTPSRVRHLRSVAPQHRGAV